MRSESASTLEYRVSSLPPSTSQMENQLAKGSFVRSSRFRSNCLLPPRFRTHSSCCSNSAMTCQFARSFPGYWFLQTYNKGDSSETTQRIEPPDSKQNRY